MSRQRRFAVGYVFPMNVSQLIGKLQELDPQALVVQANEHGDIEEGSQLQPLMYFYQTYESKLPDGTVRSWKEIQLVHPGEEEEYDDELKEHGQQLKPCVNIWN